MTRLTPFLLTAMLAGCAEPLSYLPGAVPPAEEPVGPPPVPVEVAPFLPPGTAGSVVFQDAAGCYLYSIERTDPPSGFPVRDAAGNQVCAGQPVTYAAPATVAPQTTAPLPTPAPVPLVSTTPAPATGIVTGDNTTIDGTPITQIPAPAPLPVPLPTPVE